MPLPLSASGEVRRCCPTMTCQRQLIRETRHLAHRGHFAKGDKACPRCTNSYPRTPAYWYVSKRDAEGHPVSLDGYCKTCRKARTREVYRDDPHYRQRTIDRAAEQRRVMMARRQADPQYDAEMRARKAAHSREQRRWRREHPVEGSVASSGWSSEPMDARPIVAAMETFALARGESLEATFGPSLARSARRWRSESRFASASVVDRALVLMDVLWWEVYDPRGRYYRCMSPLEWLDAVDGAALAFEGERYLG